MATADTDMLGVAACGPRGRDHVTPKAESISYLVLYTKICPVDMFFFWPPPAPGLTGPVLICISPSLNPLPLGRPLPPSLCPWLKSPLKQSDCNGPHFVEGLPCP